MLSFPVKEKGRDRHVRSSCKERRDIIFKLQLEVISSSHKTIVLSQKFPKGSLNGL